MKLKPINPSPEDIARFWKSVTKSDGCWICRANPSHIYSRLKVDGRLVLGHIVSYVIAKGQVPFGKVVCHSCDTPKCVNPYHLESKSHSKNLEDMVSRNRHRPKLGEENPHAKLNSEAVLDIRNSIINNTSGFQELADKYSTTFQCIYQVARGKSWKQVGGTLLSKRKVVNLSKEDVINIRHLDAWGASRREIADRYKIHTAVVSNIVRGVKRRDCPMVDEIPPVYLTA